MNIKEHIIYEDNHIIVINKPNGILTQGDYSGSESLFDLLKKYIKESRNKPGDVYLAMIHRLDRPVSGLLVFATTSKAAARLNKSFLSHEVTKIYFAQSHDNSPNIVPNSWIQSKGYLSRKRDTSHFSLKKQQNSQSAELFYNVIDFHDTSLSCLIKLITGRKHQIRAQLKSLGLPIIGDEKYGSKKLFHGEICLHSSYLSFEHPVLKETMNFYTEPPVHFKEVPQNLKGAIESAIKELDFNSNNKGDSKKVKSKK